MRCRMFYTLAQTMQCKETYVQTVEPCCPFVAGMLCWFFLCTCMVHVKLYKVNGEGITFDFDSLYYIS